MKHRARTCYVAPLVMAGMAFQAGCMIKTCGRVTTQVVGAATAHKGMLHAVLDILSRMRSDEVEFLDSISKKNRFVP